jgi:hypothetical protein
MLDQTAVDGGFEFHPAVLVGSHIFLRGLVIPKIEL